MNKGNWIPVDKNVLRFFPTDRAYDKVEAYVSLRIDLDTGEVKGLREYARIWKWSRKKVELFFKSMGYRTGDTKETLERHSGEKQETPLSLIFLGLETSKKTVSEKKGDTKETLERHNYKTKTKDKRLKNKKTLVSTPGKNGVAHPSEPKFSDSSWEMQVSKWFHKEMSEFYPPEDFQFMRKMDFQKCADTLDKLQRLDGKSHDGIISVLNFIIDDDFWRQNARAITTLRKKGRNDCNKFENIQAKMNGHYRE